MQRHHSQDSSTGPRARPLDWRGIVLTLGLHLPVLLLLFWDLLSPPGWNAAPRIAGSTTTETWSFLWGHYCMWHQVVDLHRLPFHLEMLDFPFGGTLWLKDQFWTFLMLPVQAVFGLAAAFNTEEISLFLLSGGAFFLLCRELGLSRFPAALASLTFSFCPHTIGEAYNGNLEAMATGWMPLWLWAMLRTIKAPGWRNALMAGLILALLPLNNPYYTLSMALASPPILALALWQWKESLTWKRALPWLAVTLFIGGLLALPQAWAMSASLSAADSLALVAPQSILQAPATSDLVHLLRPMAPLPLATADTPFQDLVYPGILLFALAMAAPLLVSATRTGQASPRRHQPWAWIWAALALFFLALSLGPVICYQGWPVGAPDNMIFLPWAYLATNLDPLARMTLPHRFATPGALFLSLGLATLLNWLAHLAREPGTCKAPTVNAVAHTESIAERQSLPRRALSRHLANRHSWNLLGRLLPARKILLLNSLLVALAAASLAEILFYPGYRLPLVTTETRPSPHAILLGELDLPGAVLNMPVFAGSNDWRIYFWYQAQHHRPVDMAIRVGVEPTVAGEVLLVRSVVILQRGGTLQQVPADTEPEDFWELPRLRELGYRFIVVHVPFFNGRQVDSLLEVLTPMLDEGLVFSDGAVVFPLDNQSRTALLERAVLLPRTSFLGLSGQVLRDSNPFIDLRPGVPGRSFKLLQDQRAP